MIRCIDYRTWQKNSKFLISTATFVTLTLFYVVYATGSALGKHGPVYNRDMVSSRDDAGNSTLGFEKILTVSESPNWRTRGLKAAARLTNLNVAIPPQPSIAEEMLKAFKDIGPEDQNTKHPSQGSAKAWLAHLDMIKFVVASRFETALIIEDDVDWDVTIRDQMKLVSRNVRAFTRMSDEDSTPYGSAWDVLWIGHCGEVTGPDTATWQYPDSSLMPTELYAGWTKKWLVNIEEGHRAIQKTKQTVCTFGYAVSRAGAQQVLRILGKGQNEAFDVALMAACQKEHLRCISVNPELMHHYNPKDGTGYVSPADEENGRGHSAEEETFQYQQGTTANIKNSARCAALFHDVCPQPPTKVEDY